MVKILVCGGLLIDRYISIDRYPLRGGDGYITDSFDVVGGCAINMAKTIRELGAEVYIVSYIGNDIPGNAILDFMRKGRLPMDCVKQSNGNTGYCFVFLEPDGERTFLTYKGCETEFTDELIPGDMVTSCPVAAVTGYYLLDDSSGRLICRLKELKSNGCKIVFDPSPLADKIQADFLKEILAISDVIIPNETEAEFLAGFSGEKTSEQWAFSCNARSSVVIIKKGADGGMLYQDGEKIPYAASCADVVDTTGAGDSFTGAIAYALGNGVPLEDGVVLAAQAAGRIVSVKGPHV